MLNTEHSNPTVCILKLLLFYYVPSGFFWFLITIYIHDSHFSKQKGHVTHHTRSSSSLHLWCTTLCGTGWLVSLLETNRGIQRTCHLHLEDNHVGLQDQTSGELSYHALTDFVLLSLAHHDFCVPVLQSFSAVYVFSRQLKHTECTLKIFMQSLQLVTGGQLFHERWMGFFKVYKMLQMHLCLGLCFVVSFKGLAGTRT